MGTPSVSILPMQSQPEPGWVLITAERTEIRLSRGHTRVLQHGSEVDSWRLSEDEGVWALDLMLDERCRARLVSTEWSFTESHGPQEAAAVSGLPLERSDTVVGGPLLYPGQLPPWLVPVSLLAAASPAVVAVLIGLDAPTWTVGLALAASLVWSCFMLWAFLGPAGETLLPARPRGTVPRSATWARLVELDGRRCFRTRSLTRVLPPPGDRFEPSVLLEVRRPALRERARQLEIRSADGHLLVNLDHEQWVGDGGAGKLADLLGVPLGEGDPHPVGGAWLGVAEAPARARIATLVVLGGIIGVMTPLARDGLAAVLVAGLGAIVVVLSLVPLAIGELRVRAGRPSVEAGTPR